MGFRISVEYHISFEILPEKGKLCVDRHVKETMADGQHLKETTAHEWSIVL